MDLTEWHVCKIPSPFFLKKKKKTQPFINCKTKFRHARKNKKTAANLNHAYIWEIGFGKLPLFTLHICVSYIFGLLKSFLTTNVYCSIMRWGKGGREMRARTREGDGKEGRQMITVSCILLS